MRKLLRVAGGLIIRRLAAPTFGLAMNVVSCSFMHLKRVRDGWVSRVPVASGNLRGLDGGLARER